MSNIFSLDDFQAQQEFPLDQFQQDAIESISLGHSVVVCAPTGSGKTIVAEYAAMRAIAQGRKLFYTTPLKALSNQKFFDLRAKYGEGNVGLLTGDTSINRDARIVVMTTEIFRNMLYGIQEDSTVLSALGYVVLDECHYMNDSERGTVWEESIIYCPDSVQLIALSATVANAAELTDWINEVHHDTRLIWSDFRPVPLRFSFYDRDHLMPLFDAPGKLNKNLKGDLKGQRFQRNKKVFRPNDLILIMAEKKMLPAIFFTFSRKDCDRHLEFTQGVKLLTPQERVTINQKIDDYVAQHPFLETSQQLPFIRNGFASHHAGLLPGLKHLVETLFQQGLIKAVFATETLAAGINMPARSTVITKISKRTNDGHRLLTASEFLQMSGRAGRRGMDEVGYVIVCSSQYEGVQEVAKLASSPPDALNSQFTPTYGMVLNLLQRNSLEKAEFLISQSFGQFTAARRLKPLLESKRYYENQIKELLGFECPYNVSDKDFHNFLHSKELIQETSRFLRDLQKQVKLHGPSPGITKQLAQEQGKFNSLRSTIEASPCEQCKIIVKHQKMEERVQREQRKLKGVNLMLADEQDTYWRRFMGIHELLRESQYLDENDCPTGNGDLTARIRTENEFAMVEVISSGVLENLNPSQLAGVISAMLNDSNRDNLWVKIKLSSATQKAVEDIDKLYRKIDRLQRKHNVQVGLALNPIASPLVEAWANGVSWDRLINSTNIGEGDIVRMLRRVADIMRQLSRVDGISRNLSLNAREGLRNIDREPIKEIELSIEEATPKAAVEPVFTQEVAIAANSVDTAQLPASGTNTESPALTLTTTPEEQSLDTPASKAVQPTETSASGDYPDWKPLGAVRDYLTEQMRHDDFRG